MFQPNHIPIISNICFTAPMFTTGRQHFEPAFSSRSQASRSVVYSITIRVEIIHLSTAKPNHPSRSAAWCCPKLTQSSLEMERKFPTVVEWLNRSRSIPIQGGSRGTSHDKHHVDGCPARSTKRPFWCFPPTKCKQTKLTVLGAGDAGGFVSECGNISTAPLLIELISILQTVDGIRMDYIRTKLEIIWIKLITFSIPIFQHRMSATNIDYFSGLPPAVSSVSRVLPSWSRKLFRPNSPSLHAGHWNDEMLQVYSMDQFTNGRMSGYFIYNTRIKLKTKMEFDIHIGKCALATWEPEQIAFLFQGCCLLYCILRLSDFMWLGNSL